MPQSHKFRTLTIPETNNNEQEAPKKQRVLVTGASGRIGSCFAEHFHQKYNLRLMVQKIDEKSDKVKNYGEVVEADLGDLPKLQEISRDIDTVLHLAGDPNSSATWESLLPNNMVGTYNMFTAAKFSGCKKIVYASSIRAVSGYSTDFQVKTHEVVNPGDLYGVTKCFGEALGRYMAEKEGVPVIAIRIGAHGPIEKVHDDDGLQVIDSFVSQRDLNQLMELCIDDQRLQFAIFNGVSNNCFKKLDISDARELLGYQPLDDATNEHPLIKDAQLSKTIMAHSVIDPHQKSGIRNQLA
eukprot:TRINITY_DN5079_c4_g2_i2.p1 TRINITY_DN5079_c4_g2~~TRINITY_DN5079_c4_g2_i2.p1  ORF type:complete len:297 (-),score=46.04 TRINITY_DN5079_c4_g2_i2:524-1414(-)